MTLKAYFDKPHNSVIKETIFNYRLFYDIKIASAKNNNDVQIYFPEIDLKGYDIILDDNDTLKPFQIKTVGKITSSSVWPNIHKNLIRPNRQLSHLLFSEESPATIGIQGGFILINPILSKDENNVKEIHYYYSDIVIITCFSLGIISKYKNSQSKAKSFLTELIKGKSTDKIKIPIDLMVKAKDMASLLALSDLHSTKSSSYLSTDLMKYLKEIDSREINRLNKDIISFFKMTSNDKELKYVNSIMS